MKTNGKEKAFDAVKTMREIRDQISREIMNMTFAEEKAYLKKLTSGAKRRVFAKAGQELVGLYMLTTEN